MEVSAKGSERPFAWADYPQVPVYLTKRRSALASSCQNASSSSQVPYAGALFQAYGSLYLAPCPVDSGPVCRSATQYIRGVHKQHESPHGYLPLLPLLPRTGTRRSPAWCTALRR